MLQIEQLRTHLNLTKKEFAEELGITQQTYTNYIKGKREILVSIAKQISKKHDISLDWLILGRGFMKLSDVELQLKKTNDAEKIEEALKLVYSKFDELTLEIKNLKNIVN